MDLSNKTLSELVSIYNVAAYRAGHSAIAGFRTAPVGVEKTTTMLAALKDPDLAEKMVADPGAFPSTARPLAEKPAAKKASAAPKAEKPAKAAAPKAEKGKVAAKASPVAKGGKKAPAVAKPMPDTVSQPEGAPNASQKAEKAPKQPRGERKPAGADPTGKYADVSWLRPGSVKHKLFHALNKEIGHFVKVDDLIQSVYGKTDKELSQALGMSLLGIIRSFKDENVPLRAEKKREGGVSSIALFPAS